MEISKFLFMTGEEPRYVVYRTSLPVLRSLYELLGEAGVGSWQTEFEVAREEGREVAFYSGVGWAGDTFENMNCIGFGELVFLLGDDIDWNSEVITIENVFLYMIEEVEGNWVPITKWQKDSLDLKLDPATHKTIVGLIKERQSDFLYDYDDDDNEFLSFQEGRESSLADFESEDGSIYTVGWQDLDDLSELSKCWPFTLKFSQD